MKILLINPPDTKALNPEIDPPFNLMMLATVLKMHNLDVSIAEWASMTNINDIPDADIYGITITTPTYNSSVALAVQIRMKRPLARIIVGGPHVSVIDIDFADIVVKGHCLNNIYSIITGGNGICIGEPHLDLGYPLSWDLVDMHKYISGRYIPECKKTISYIASTGCPMKCKFCYNPYLKLKPEHTSPYKIKQDMNYLINNYEIDGINILNDNNNNQSFLWDLLNDLGLYWRAEFSINNIVDAKNLYQKGCRYCVIGIESGSDRMLSLMNKMQNKNQICNVVNKLNDAGILVRGLFMVGFPGETWYSVEETANLMQLLPFDSISVNLFVPYPGTNPYHNPTKFGIEYLSADFSKYRGHPINGALTPVFTTRELSTDTLIKMHAYLESVMQTRSV